MVRHPLLNGRHPPQMADQILGHGVRIAGNQAEERGGLDPQQGGKLPADRVLHLVIVHLKQLGLQGPADKGTQQDVVGRGTPGVFHAGEGTRNN